MAFFKKRHTSYFLRVKTRLFNIWEALHTTYWFVPGLIVMLGVLLALALVYLHEHGIVGPVQFEWLRQTSPAGARTLLSTLSGSIITVAGVAFSITIVALTLASSQFGPRLLRNFMRDGGNQFVLGVFLATFAYCVIVLRTIQDNGIVFVPHLAIAVAAILALANVAVLIYFIHHVASAINASYVINGVATELEQTIERLFPDEYEPDKTPDESSTTAIKPDNSTVVSINRSGYIQAIDIAALLNLANKHDWTIKLVQRPGKFVTPGMPLAYISCNAELTEKAEKAITRAMLLGVRRTPEQDVEFLIHQLVEIALRALSPGVNDPFTALDCVDRLGGALILLAQRKLPSALCCDDAGQCRLLIDPPTFPGLANTALDQMRQYGASSMAVSLRLLEMLAWVIPHAVREGDGESLQKHARMIQAACAHQHDEKHDLEDLQRRYQHIQDVIAESEHGTD